VRCFTATYKNKEFQQDAFLLSTSAQYLSWQNWAKCFRRYALTLHRWKLP